MVVIEEQMEAASEEEQPLISEGSQPNPNPNPNPKSVTTKVPEVEVRLYRSGKGPVATFQSPLGGWDRDRLEVQDILDKYGLKSLHAFSPEHGRGVPVRFSARNGRSFVSYHDGGVVFVDGEPKDSLLKPITKILFGVAMLTILIAIFVKEAPEWFQTSRLSNGKFPPWVLACAVILFTRLSKRTKNFLTKRNGQ